MGQRHPESSTDVPRYHISPEQIQLHGIIGKGSFGVVHRGELRTGLRKTPIAVKRCLISKKKPAPSNIRLSDDVEREIMLLSDVPDHENVLKCYGGFFLPDERDKDFLLASIVLEWCEGGDLKNWLQYQKRHGVELSPTQRLSVLLQIAKGMRHLHSSAIIHYDLADDNILFSSKIADEAVVKICDFGISRHEKTVGSSFRAGKFQYMPPSFSGDKKKVDVFSFGIVSWETWCGKRAHGGARAPKGEALRDAVRSGLRPDLAACGEDCPPDLLRLMTRCWSENQMDRPLFDEIVQILKHVQEQMIAQINVPHRDDENHLGGGGGGGGGRPLRQTPIQGREVLYLEGVPSEDDPDEYVELGGRLMIRRTTEYQGAIVVPAHSDVQPSDLMLYRLNRKWELADPVTDQIHEFSAPTDGCLCMRRSFGYVAPCEAFARPRCIAIGCCRHVVCFDTDHPFQVRFEYHSCESEKIGIGPYSVILGTDGTSFFASSENGRSCRFQMNPGSLSLEKRLPFESNAVSCSPMTEQVFFARKGSGVVSVHERRTLLPSYQIPIDDRAVSLISIDHTLFAGLEDGKIYAWDLCKLPLPCWTLAPHTSTLVDIHRLQSEEYLFASVSRESVALWNGDGKLLCQSAHSCLITASAMVNESKPVLAWHPLVPNEDPLKLQDMQIFELLESLQLQRFSHAFAQREVRFSDLLFLLEDQGTLEELIPTKYARDRFVRRVRMLYLPANRIVIGFGLRCDVAKRNWEFLSGRRMGLSDEWDRVFDHKFDTCYCASCWEPPQGFSTKILNGQKHSFCKGWTRFALKVSTAVQQRISRWHKAFHGTDHRSAAMMIKSGCEFLKPGNPGQTSKLLPGEATRVYATPSLEYARCYAPHFQPRLSSQMSFRVVFEIRVVPDSFLVSPYSRPKFPFDDEKEEEGEEEKMEEAAQSFPPFLDEELEWSTERGDVFLISGLLVTN